MFILYWEIRTHEHEDHAGDSRRHNVGGGAPTLGGGGVTKRRLRGVGGADV